MGASLFKRLVLADPTFFDSLTDDERTQLEWDWSVNGRPEQQIPEGDWDAWAVIAGRGWGKTRTGAEYAIHEARRLPKSRGALVGATSADAWEVMVYGESGIMASSPPWFRPTVYKRQLVWPNGTVAKPFTAERPDRLRGPQHHWYWADELAAWKYPETWDQLLLGLRLGDHPRGIVTTTPRPTEEIKALIADARTHVTGGSTYDNAANLSRRFLRRLLDRYEGTRLGDQEIWAEVLKDTPGALWTHDELAALRVDQMPNFWKAVIAIDPAVSTKEGSAETGIICAGVGPCYCHGGDEPLEHGFVFEDRSGVFTPLRWGRRAIKAYQRYEHNTALMRMVAETNNGGDLVISNVESIDDGVHGIHPISVKASDGKRTRAEPVSALYEQGRVHHVGRLAKLEDQMCTWTPLIKGIRSPDRVDALVWALTFLMVDTEDASLPEDFIVPWMNRGRASRRLSR